MDRDTGEKVREASAPIEDGPRTDIARRTVLKGALATAPLLLVGPSFVGPREARAATSMGPSTTTEPYMIPSIDGVETVSILTVGDDVGGYRMAGIPDGLGAFRGKRGEFTLLMNHEITAGVPSCGRTARTAPSSRAGRSIATGRSDDLGNLAVAQRLVPTTRPMS
jgi:hypothetical protein